VQGEKLKVKFTGGEVFVNGAIMVVKDVLMENGVVHVVDGVLMPSESQGGGEWVQGRPEIG
jgi:uncharacterized surface protein with fasciclin (FAS1) repeats